MDARKAQNASPRRGLFAGAHKAHNARRVGPMGARRRGVSAAGGLPMTAARNPFRHLGRAPGPRAEITQRFGVGGPGTALASWAYVPPGLKAARAGGR